MDNVPGLDLDGNLSGAPCDALATTLARYVPIGDLERADMRRIIDLVDSSPDPWDRSAAVHLTASAIVVHAASGRVLLRWHERHQRFMQVGGHGDPGEWDPLTVALREAAEETCLHDLRSVDRPPRIEAGDLVQAVVVPVPARSDEPAHEHADLRFLLETDRPEDARPETPTSPVRWMSWDEALVEVEYDNLRVLIERARRALA